MNEFDEMNRMLTLLESENMDNNTVTLINGWKIGDEVRNVNDDEDIGTITSINNDYEFIIDNNWDAHIDDYDKVMRDIFNEDSNLLPKDVFQLKETINEDKTNKLKSLNNINSLIKNRSKGLNLYIINSPKYNKIK